MPRGIGGKGSRRVAADRSGTQYSLKNRKNKFVMISGTPWNRSGLPRKCGVNGGLSDGTNDRMNIFRASCEKTAGLPEFLRETNLV